jgi:hypothetical protein
MVNYKLPDLVELSRDIVAALLVYAAKALPLSAALIKI